MAITFTGLGSGLDANAIIDQLTELERAPIKSLETKKTGANKQLSLFGDLASKLKAVKTALGKVDTSGELAAFRATSGNTSLITATASSTAQPGIHDLTVSALARAESDQSIVLPSDTAGVAGDGTLSITVGTDAAVDITWDSNDSLSDIADRINDSDARVRASVVNVGNGYRLVVTSESTGTANAISFAESGDSLGFLAADAEAQSAQDAQLRLDGVLVTRSSNEIDDLISGVTLSLQATTPAGGAATRVTVDRDPASTKDRVKGVVDALSSVFTSVNAQLGNEKANRNDSLAGDPTVRSLQRRLGAIFTQGVDHNNTTISLSRFGVSISKDGTISFDETKFAEAAASDPAALDAIFTGENGIATVMSDLVDEYTASDGVLAGKQSGLRTRVADYDRQIERIEDRAAQAATRLRAQYTALDRMVSELSSQSSYISSLFGS